MKCFGAVRFEPPFQVAVKFYVTFDESSVELFCLCYFYVIMSTTYESEAFIKTDRTILHCVSD